jgi:hypothetical protein
VRGLSATFLVGGLGVEDQQWGLRKFRIIYHVIYFCGFGPKKKLPIKMFEEVEQEI